MVDIPDFVDPEGPADQSADPGAPVDAASAAERRPRLSRPASSLLFSAKQSGENGGTGPRNTRVIPALAGHGATEVQEGPETPAAVAPEPTPDADTGPQDFAERRLADAPPEEPGVDYPPDLVFIVRADGTVLYVNRPLGRQGEEDVIGSDFYDWVFPEQHGLVREALDRVFTTGRADGVELTGIQQHEPEAWYECRIAPNHRDGKVVSATIIARDVTRYKIAERTLRHSHVELERLVEERSADVEQLKTELSRRPAEQEEALADAHRFRALLDAAGEAIFVTDPKSDTLVDVNETGCRWLRTSRDALRGQNVNQLGLEFPVLPPVELDVQFTETRDTRRPLMFDGLHRRQDGTTFPVEVAVAPHTVGDREYVLAVVRDVKGRRRADEALVESEARYHALLQQSFDAVFLTTRGGQIVEANAAAHRLFGYDDGGFVGVDARTLMPRVDDVRRFQREMAEAGTVVGLEAELRQRDGAGFAALLSATRRRDANERLLGYQWVVRRLPDPPAETPAPAVVEPVKVAELVEEEAFGAASLLEAPTVVTNALLLVDGETRARGEAHSALGSAGWAVLAAGTAREAIQLLRANTPGVVVAVVGPTPDAAPEDLARDLRAVYPQLKIILSTPEDPFGVLERAADLAVDACLRHPVHPLALVQSVRDAMGELPGA